MTQKINAAYLIDDKIKISLNGQLFEGVVKAAIQYADGWRYQVAFGENQTALVYEWQIVWRVVTARS